MFCIKYGDEYLGWTLETDMVSCQDKYFEKSPSGRWAYVTGKAVCIPVTVIIMEKGSVTQ